MTCTVAETFQHVTHIGNDQLTNILEASLKYWYDWAFLKIGGWVEINLGNTSIHGQDMSRLRLVTDEEDPSYTEGQVWEGFRQDWVWETGVDYEDVDEETQNPLVVGTPTINGVAAVGAYHVNYPLGRIIFDSVISTTATVKVAHSYRKVQVFRADNAPWFRQLQFRSFRGDVDQFLAEGKGEWSIGGQHRIQMPALVIEAVPSRTASGRELGSNSLNVDQDVVYHILAENRIDRNNLIDIIHAQTDKTIWLFNTNTVNAASAFPLDYRGMKVGNNMYPDLVDENTGYRYRRCIMKNARVFEMEPIHINLYQAAIRTTMEIILGGT